MKQLVVRVDPELIRQLKIVAAHYNISMAELVRRSLADEVEVLRMGEKGIEDALSAAGL